MFFLTISCFIIVICGIIADDEKQWLIFKKDYNKTYSSAEEESRRQAFFTNIKEIEKHNEDFNLGKRSFRMEINEFADMLSDEFDGNSMFDYTNDLEFSTHIPRKFDRNSTPDYVNWIERGYSNPVLRQGHCGSCYAFASVAAIEAQYFIKHKQLINLSQQDAVNCAVSYGAHGCISGRSVYVFDMVKKRGIQFLKDEPYKTKNDTCKSEVLGTKKNNHSFVKIKDYRWVTPNDEEELKQAVAKIGPIVVSIHSTKSLHLYKGDIYYEPNCKNAINHAVLIVGYGTTEKGEDYWLVRNSWGEKWGDRGHVLMSRNRGNNCNIAKFPIYPIDPVIMGSNKLT